LIYRTLFYNKIQESHEFDLALIMGTSLNVYPFARIPRLMKTPSWKIVFNRDKVGQFLYSFLFSNTLFIQGTTDDTIKKFLKDVDLLDDFKDFVKINYGDDNIDNNDNIQMIEINKDNNDADNIENQTENKENKIEKPSNLEKVNEEQSKA